MEVPVEMPDTSPVLASIVATAVLLLFHSPPVVTSAKVVVVPAQIVVSPVIVPTGITSNIEVAAQPSNV